MIQGFKAKTIKPTKTVGQRLRSARKKKGYTLTHAERLTKVKLKYLKALEEDRHDLLPTEVYSLGFLRCYAEALGLSTKKLLEQYHFERQAIDSAKLMSRTALVPAKRLAGPRFLVTPKLLIAAGSLIVVAGLILYIGNGVRGFLAPPALTIEEPRPDSRVGQEKLVVVGITDPAVSLAINGELVAVEPSGKFKREITLIPGLNILEFVAINRIGKETRTERKVLADFIIPEATPAADVSPGPSLSPDPQSTPSPTPSPAASITPSPAATPSPLPSSTPPSTEN